MFDIFKNLNYQNIINYCITNKSINDICNGNYIWRLLLNHKHPSSLKIIDSMKNPKYTLQNYFMSLDNYDNRYNTPGYLDKIISNINISSPLQTPLLFKYPDHLINKDNINYIVNIIDIFWDIILNANLSNEYIKKNGKNIIY